MVKVRDDVDGRSDGKHELKLVGGDLEVAGESQAADLENGLDIEEAREYDLMIIYLYMNMIYVNMICI